MGGRFEVGFRVVVGTLRLEVDGSIGPAPEVGDGVATMPPARAKLETTSTLGIWARLTWNRDKDFMKIAIITDNKKYIYKIAC